MPIQEKKKTIKNTNICRLNNTLLNNQLIMEEIKNEIKIHIEKIKKKENTTTQKPVGHCKSSPKGKDHSNTGTPQETRKKSNK